MPFIDRADAGRRLAGLLKDARGTDAVVLGLPRGGIPVAFEIARALGAPLDVILVRKIGLPSQPELAMGAIGEDGVRIVNQNVVRMEHISEQDFAAVEQDERAELERRANRYRADRPRVPLAGRTAIVVDDGIATGSTARAACQVVRAHGAARVVLAVPVAPRATVNALADAADEVVCLEVPEPFFAIGQWYRDFSQTADEEVVDLLRRAATGAAAGAREEAGVEAHVAAGDGGEAGAGGEAGNDVAVLAGPGTLPGRLTVPPAARGIVLFAHGSGSSMNSPRNMFVAGALHVVRLGTLLFDLLTPEEEADRSNVFDIDLLASRLSAATAWLRAQPGMERIGVGYFGASTGAAAALRAAAEPGNEVAAIVSRGGRPDLAGPALGAVRAPTLLIVGGLDDRVLALNAEARAHLRSENQLAVIPGATHLFPEPGSLEEVASLARDWFTRYLGAAQPAGR
ncbi:MAG TPA: phosphoribosyltransferase family protein [Streptosporangiaceae bacterium]|nr:phosphoribosyltransferase family protein [Streptosporangiaceae bacterium]